MAKKKQKKSERRGNLKQFYLHDEHARVLKQLAYDEKKSMSELVRTMIARAAIEKYGTIRAMRRLLGLTPDEFIPAHPDDFPDGWDAALTEVAVAKRKEKRATAKAAREAAKGGKADG